MIGMNRVLLALNIVFLLALAYLYYAFFSETKFAQPLKTTADSTGKANFKIAYFDMDTLEKNYTYAKETRDYLNGRNEAMNAKLNKIRNDYTAKINDYNKRGASLSQTEQSQMQEDLARLQNMYDQQQQSLGQEFQGVYMQKMLDLKNKIQDFLKKYSQQKGYEYVFATSSDDNVIYYRDSVRNITTELVDQLNLQYQNSKKK
jgi:outer membrane protein